MRILYFSYAYPNAAAPAQGTFNRSLLAALARHHQVRVVSPVSFLSSLQNCFRGPSPFDDQYIAVPGIPAEYLPFYYPPKICREKFGEFLWWSVRKRLEQTIREFRPDVILSYWTHPDGEVAVRAGQLHDIPVVTMAGGSDVLLLARSGRRRDAILNVLHNADAVVAVSNHLAETLKADGIDDRKLHVVRRGIDQSLFFPGDRVEARLALGLSPGRFTLVSVGRLVPVKGHTHLLTACAKLHQEGHSFACYILGSGPLQSQLARQIRKSGLERVVHLPGSCRQSALARWYRAADVAVLPSLSEGIPNVLLEAMACGTPFIASEVGGIPEIADPLRDDLVPNADPEALTGAIRRRLTSQRTEEFAATSRRSFFPGSWDDAAQELCEVFQSIGVRESKSIPSAEQQLQLTAN